MGTRLKSELLHSAGSNPKRMSSHTVMSPAGRPSWGEMTAFQVAEMANVMDRRVLA